MPACCRPLRKVPSRWWLGSRPAPGSGPRWLGPAQRPFLIRGHSNSAWAVAGKPALMIVVGLVLLTGVIV